MSARPWTLLRRRFPKPSPQLPHLLNSHTLRQIPWEIHIQPLLHRQPISNQLQWNNIQQSLQYINCARNLDAFRFIVGELGIAFVADYYGSAAASDDLLVGIQGFAEDVVAGEDHDYGEVFVDEGEDAVFEFAGHDGFAVEVGDFFDFEGT